MYSGITINKEAPKELYELLKVGSQIFEIQKDGVLVQRITRHWSSSNGIKEYETEKEFEDRACIYFTEYTMEENRIKNDRKNRLIFSSALI